MRMTVIILTVLILTIYKAPASLSWRLHLPGLGVLSNSSPVAVKLCSHIRLSLVLVLNLNLKTFIYPRSSQNPNITLTWSPPL